MEEFAEMGRVIIFGAKQVAGQKSIGKGQCPLCHTFEPGNNIGRCPNLFGVEKRSHDRIKEDRYKTNLRYARLVRLNLLQVLLRVSRRVIFQKNIDVPNGPDELIGEDYIRESCNVSNLLRGRRVTVRPDDTKSPMPVIVKPPISLSRVEVNAVIAYLQSKDTPGEFAASDCSIATG